jgi:hypothetical protein
MGNEKPKTAGTAEDPEAPPTVGVVPVTIRVPCTSSERWCAGYVAYLGR